jgi:hypothetical protein
MLESVIADSLSLGTIVSSALRYSAGSFCFMTTGTKRIALMNGISSLTAQLYRQH